MAEMYTFIEEEFIKYSERNNLDITLDTMLYTEKNVPQGNGGAYEPIISIQLKKKNIKNMIYIFLTLYIIENMLIHWKI